MACHHCALQHGRRIAHAAAPPCAPAPQALEGLGVGAAALEAQFRGAKLYGLAAGFSLTAPLGIALGVGLHRVLRGTDPRYLYTLGVVDAVAAGMLLYGAGTASAPAPHAALVRAARIVGVRHQLSRPRAAPPSETAAKQGLARGPLPPPLPPPSCDRAHECAELAGRVASRPEGVGAGARHRVLPRGRVRDDCDRQVGVTSYALLRAMQQVVAAGGLAVAAHVYAVDANLAALPRRPHTWRCTEPASRRRCGTIQMLG